MSALKLATDQAFTLADPDHASAIRNPNKVQKEAATAPETSGSGRCRCGATNCYAKLPAVASAITRFELNRCAVAETLLQPILHFRLLL